MMPADGVAAAGRELEAAVGEHPLQLLVEEEERRERGRVVRLVEPRVLDARSARSSVAGIQRPVACDAFDALDRGRGAAARATARRRSRSTSAARSSTTSNVARVDAHAAGGRRAVDDDERVADRRPMHAARSRRSTSRCAGTRRRRPRRVERSRGVSPGAVSHTCGSSRCGAARVTAANFDENSPSTRCELRCSTRPNAAASQNNVEPPMPSSTS